MHLSMISPGDDRTLHRLVVPRKDSKLKHAGNYCTAPRNACPTPGVDMAIICWFTIGGLSLRAKAKICYQRRGV